GVRVIVERVDARIRELEKLPPLSDQILWSCEVGQSPGETGQAPSLQESALKPPTDDRRPTTVFSMNGLRFHYDALAGQKTGAFLDQRENYAAVEHYAHGEALD